MSFAIRGAAAVRLTGNSIGIFALSATKAYKFTGISTAWTAINNTSTDFSLATDDYWVTRQYGTNLLAANINDNTQTIDVNSGTNFAALGGSPPKARSIEIIGDFVQLGNLSTLSGATTPSTSVQWSGLNDMTQWARYTENSDAQQFPDGGDVQAQAGYELGGLVFQSDAVRQQIEDSSGAIFDFHRIDPARGTSSPYSVVKDGADVYYYSTTGFMRITGLGRATSGLYGGVDNIGINRVNDWFNGDRNKTRPKCIIGALDPLVRRIFWLYARSGNASSTTLDGLIVYDIERDRWTHATCALTYLFQAATAGVTLLGLTTLYSTLIGVPFPLGSDIWKGGAPGLAAFDANGALNFFTGTPMAASVQTSPFQPIEGKRALIQGFRLRSDASTATGKIGGAARPQDPIIFNGPQSLTAQGRIPARLDARVMQVEVDVPAGATWTSLAGVDFDDEDIVATGKR